MCIKKVNTSPHFIRGAEFFYVYDGDGNIVRSIDICAKKEYTYQYEEGRIVRATEADVELNNEIATINPFRYRGYYYDEEIELYYLQSRYYDAGVGRFVNGDSAQTILSEGLGCVGYNIFAYCQNTPINGRDIDGQTFVIVFAKIILGIVLGVFTQLIFDVLDYLVSLISDSNAKLSAKPIDYISSILSSILSFFDIRKPWIRYTLNLSLIIAPYFHCDFREPATTYELISDLMFFFVGEIVGGGLDRKKTKKIEKAKKKISKNKNKLTKAMKKARQRKREISIKQEFDLLGFEIGFALNISNKLVNSIADMLIK